MTYDPINRMTDQSVRKIDDTRTSDHTQILGNQQHFETTFDVGHSTTDGSHDTVHVPDLHEYADRVGLGVNPVPLTDIPVALQILHPTTFAVSVAFFQRADVGASLTGIYEVGITFGGDRAWAAYASLRKVGDE